MACRFPGRSDTPDAFWQLLDGARDAVTEVPGERWDIDRYYDPDPSAPGKMATRHGAFLERVDQFDAAFFGIAPREATYLDPQQRLLLEVAWEALENAHLAPERFRQSATGVYVGITCFDHAIQVSNASMPSSSYAGTGSALNMAAGRLSFVLASPARAWRSIPPARRRWCACRPAKACARAKPAWRSRAAST